MKIEKLTKAQIDRMAEFRDEWLNIGLCTDPANRPEAEKAIREMYVIAKCAEPEKIVWCGSPLSAGIVRAILVDKKTLDSVGDSVRDSVWASVVASVGASVWASVGASVVDSVRDSVWASVVASVGASVRDSVGASVVASVGDSVGASVGDSVYGQHDAAWLAFYRYFHDVCGLKNETERLNGLWNLARNAGWALPHSKICFISERHNICSLENSRIHCESGPAIAYPDGFEIYAIHGVRVPKLVVTAPHNQTLEQIENEPNAEIKRIRIERFGWQRYLAKSDATVLDLRQNDVDGTKESLMQSRDGSRVLVCACPSTARVYAMRVPRETLNCEQAQRWLHGERRLNIVGAS